MKRRKRRLPRTSSRPWWQLRRRLPFTCTCLPTFGTTSSIVSRVRRRVGLLVPVFPPTVCGLLASTAQREFRSGLSFSPGLWSEGGHIYLDMSDHTCGVALDATVPEVALDMSQYCAEHCGDSAVADYHHRRLPCCGAEACPDVPTVQLQFVQHPYRGAEAVSDGLAPPTSPHSLSPLPSHTQTQTHHHHHPPLRPLVSGSHLFDAGFT